VLVEFVNYATGRLWGIAETFINVLPSPWAGGARSPGPVECEVEGSG